MPDPLHNTAPVAQEIDVVLLRHGQSAANELGVYTGWGDAPLSAGGRAQVHRTGKKLREDGVRIDVVHTSLLTRAQQTVDLLMQHRPHREPPVHRDWRLNERHLGLLQGLTRAQVISRWGNQARQRWRSDPTAAPPAVSPHSPDHPGNQDRYSHVAAGLLPGAESVNELTSRVLNYWHTNIRLDISAGRNVLVVAHRDTLRAIISHLDNHHNARFADLSVPTAHLFRYRIDPTHPCQSG